MMRFRVFMCLMVSIFLSACNNSEDKTSSNKKDTIQYLFLAHTRTEQNPEVIKNIQDIDFSRYQMLWLGGDLAQLSSENQNTLNYLDQVFDLKNKNTFWALGNHDYTSISLIKQTIQKPRYYAQYKNGITVMVLDTQDSLCHITGEQFRLFNNTIDTLSKSSHLVLLHHKLIWLYGNEELENKANELSNAPIDSCSYCINPNNFYQDIYPRLIELKKKGIEVVCVGGDIGFKTQKFEHTTPEDIHFLASGMSFNAEQNYGLVFKHDPGDRTLKWEFKSLDEL